LTVADSLRANASELEGFARTILARVGVPDDDAGVIAGSLVASNLRGVDSHGVRRLPGYVDDLERGRIERVARVRVVRSAPPVEVLDGGNGMGQVVAARAVERALRIAADPGLRVGIVGARSSNHFGAAGHYALMAASKGMIGAVATNAVPTLAPWGGMKAAIGNNPWSVAFPCRELGHPVLLDVANSLTSFGKLRHLIERGSPIPEGWVMNADGRPTTDPEEARNGTLLPMGGHKGYAISFIVEALAGALTGAGCLPRDRGEVGHLVLAIDIAAFCDRDEFERRVSRLARAMKEAPKAPGFDRIYVPGEIEHLREVERRGSGIPIPMSVVRALSDLGKRYEVECPLRGDSM